MTTVEYNDDIGTSPTLNQNVTTDTELKKLIVDYVGTSTNPEDGDVTVESIVQIMSKEFPEFVMAIAEENFFRGYHQAMCDVEYGEKILNELEQEQTESNIENTSV